jgi:hypothetical protein
MDKENPVISILPIAESLSINPLSKVSAVNFVSSTSLSASVWFSDSRFPFLQLIIYVVLNALN